MRTLLFTFNFRTSSAVLLSDLLRREGLRSRGDLPLVSRQTESERRRQDRQYDKKQEAGTVAAKAVEAVAKQDRSRAKNESAESEPIESSERTLNEILPYQKSQVVDL